MRGNCILTSGLLFVTLSLAIAKHKQSHFSKSCYPRGTLSRAVDMLYVKAAWLKATIPEDHIKNIRLLKKKSKKLFLKNCRFREQLLSFFMEDVFGQLQLQVCKEIHFVEEFHSLRQKLSRCVIIIPTKRVFTTIRLEGEENNALKHSILGEIETYGSDCRLQWRHSEERPNCSYFNIWKQKHSSAFNIPSIPLFARDLYSSALVIRFMISCASSAREMKSITRIKRIFYGIGNRGIYKAITELDILLSWIKQFLENIK